MKRTHETWWVAALLLLGMVACVWGHPAVVLVSAGERLDHTWQLRRAQVRLTLRDQAGAPVGGLPVRAVPVGWPRSQMPLAATASGGALCWPALLPCRFRLERPSGATCAEFGSEDLDGDGRIEVTVR